MCTSKIQSHKLYQFSILLGVSLSEVNFASCQFYDRIILWQSFYTRVYLWNYRSINIPVKIFFANSLSKPHRKNPFNWSKVEKKPKHPDGWLHFVMPSSLASHPFFTYPLSSRSPFPDIPLTPWVTWCSDKLSGGNLVKPLSLQPANKLNGIRESEWVKRCWWFIAAGVNILQKKLEVGVISRKYKL